MDLGFVGPMFTWYKHFQDYTIWERLDRSMATNDWFSMFPNTKAYHLMLQLLIINHYGLCQKGWSASNRDLLDLNKCG